MGTLFVATPDKLESQTCCILRLIPESIKSCTLPFYPRSLLATTTTSWLCQCRFLKLIPSSIYFTNFLTKTAANPFLLSNTSFIFHSVQKFNAACLLIDFITNSSSSWKPPISSSNKTNFKQFNAFNVVLKKTRRHINDWKTYYISVHWTPSKIIILPKQMIELTAWKSIEPTQFVSKPKRLLIQQGEFFNHFHPLCINSFQFAPRICLFFTINSLSCKLLDLLLITIRLLLHLRISFFFLLFKHLMRLFLNSSKVAVISTDFSASSPFLALKSYHLTISPVRVQVQGFFDWKISIDSSLRPTSDKLLQSWKHLSAWLDPISDWHSVEQSLLLEQTYQFQALNNKIYESCGFPVTSGCFRTTSGSLGSIKIVLYPNVKNKHSYYRVLSES